ncbi:hypothetical protein K1719_039286 [Acacia pycnantha]|nr:hypothetical protein K1719_039286 [Acacia pycnantha]
MELIRKVARAKYANLRDEEKREMERKFKAMDKDGDGKISLHEFTSHSDQYTKSFFSLLDQNKDGFLQFDEVLTLSYITSSGRPFCAVCKDFIPALFFTCTQCRFIHNSPPLTYDLCINCYQGGKFQHQHTEFEDNYTLLLDLSSPQQAKPSDQSDHQLSASPFGDQPFPPKLGSKMKRAFKKILAGVSGVVSTITAGLGNSGEEHEVEDAVARDDYSVNED